MGYQKKRRQRKKRKRALQAKVQKTMENQEDTEIIDDLTPTHCAFCGSPLGECFCYDGDSLIFQGAFRKR